MVVTSKVLGLLGLAARAGKVIAGADVCEEAIKKRKIWSLIICEDASEKTKKNFKYLCEDTNVVYLEFGNIEEVSKAIGKSYKAVIGIREKNFSNQIIKLIDGGEADE